MIKHSEFDFSYDYLRFDTTWLFEWNINDINGSTQRLYPFTETAGDSKTWFFQGESGASVQHSDIWVPTDPWLEYDANNIKRWNDAHPNNETRYLTPDSSFIKLTNTVETVVIDNIPPSFVSDKDTEYIWLKEGKSDITRHCSFVFKDQAGLDFKQFAIFIGKPDDLETLNETAKDKKDAKTHKTDEMCLYYYSRKHDWAIYNEDLIDPSSLTIKADGYHTYKIEFDMKYGASDDEVKRLNTEGLQLYVWDKAGNGSVYAFGKDEKEKSGGVPGTLEGRRWLLVDSDSDIADLDKLVIKFYDAEPENMIVNENQLGSVWCSIYNPNRDFWPIDVVVQLSDTSVGRIDMSTYDDSKYYDYMNPDDEGKSTGVVRFKIVDIQKYGKVEVQAWLQTGNKNFDDIMKASTYAEESCGPWIIKDAEGRVYNIRRYVPKYLRNTDYYQFIEFFELFLNTMYTNLTKGTNISILEKIAKISDFNDIDRIEHGLAWHFAKSFGCEYDIDLDTMQKLNLGFLRYSTADEEAFIESNRTEDDVIDIIKYAIKCLPMYNQIKGSEKGVIMALKMFSMSCKMINLWVKMSPQVEENPDFVEEDRMYDFASYFLTSRFNIEFNSLNVDFPTFNDNLDAFVRFIRSIKPLIRILNLIKYTVIFNNDYYWLVNDYVHDDMIGEQDLSYRYTIKWDGDSIDEMIKRSKVNKAVNHATRIWINYNADSCVVIPVDSDGKQVLDTSVPDPPDINSLYSFFAEYMSNSNGKFAFRYKNDPITYEYTVNVYNKKTGVKETTGTLKGTESLMFRKEFSISDFDAEMLESGFYIYPKTGELATCLTEFIKPSYYMANKISELLAADKIKLGDKTYTSDTYTWELVDTQITNNAEMEMIVDHVPGTEIYRSVTKYE